MIIERFTYPSHTPYPPLLFLCPNFHLSLPQFSPAFLQPLPNTHSICLFSIKDRHKKPPSTCYFPQNHKNTAKNAICPNKICIFQKKVVTLQAESYTNTIVFGTKLRIPTDNVPPPSPEGATSNNIGVHPYGKRRPPPRPSAPKGRHNYIVNH